MYRSILVPLDMSLFAEHALPLALSIARRSGAALQLVSVHPPSQAVYAEAGLTFAADIDSELKRRKRAYLDAAARCVHIVSSVPVSCACLEGPIAEQIHAQAKSSGAALVVMTTHARGPMSRFWLGSVADQLVRQLSMPVLLVRPAEAAPDLAQEPVLKHLLLPLDGSPLAEQIIEPALALGTLMDAEYTLLRVIKPVMPENYAEPMLPQAAQVVVQRVHEVHEQLRQEAEGYLERVAERLRARSLRVQTRIAFEEQPGVAILHKAEALGADLIALETHGRRGLPRLLLGSVADKVLRGGSLPLLVHRPRS